MDLIVIGSNLLKIFIMFLLTYFVYKKIMNYKYKDRKEIIFINLCCVNISILYVLLTEKLSAMSVIFILYFVYGVIIKFILEKQQLDYRLISYVLACAISYIIYLTATLTSSIIWIIILKHRDYRNPINFILISIITYIIYAVLFRKTRFKNGFNFLKRSKINDMIEKAIIILAIVTTIIFSYPRKMEDLIFKICLLSVSVISTCYIIIWIKSQITKTYKSKMRDRTIEIQKTEIDEKNRILQEVKEENLNFATTIHKYNKKISALEYIIKSRLEQETNTEFANELAVILKETKETAENFAKETEIKTNKIPETNVPGIDTMLKYMQEEARKKNINFDVKLNASINPLLESTISKDKFETLIGDHLKDAIIAVEASKNSYKSILVTMGLVEGIYEFSVYDTGIEFEIETLLKLGEEQITTHKETGGSGIGFMTTFETLKECKASLIIEEYNPETTSYTKCITIRFDGKNKYKIYSYRASKIKEQKHKRKITIEEIK